MYFFPMWFETVRLDSEAVAGEFLCDFSFYGDVKIMILGLHLMPNSISTTTGSLFAGYVRVLVTSPFCSLAAARILGGT